MIQSVKEGFSCSRPFPFQCASPGNEVTRHRGEETSGPGVQPAAFRMSHIIVQQIAACLSPAWDPFWF